MKLKKVLSGFVSAAILATTTAIVMPLGASAEDVELSIDGVSYEDLQKYESLTFTYTPQAQSECGHTGHNDGETYCTWAQIPIIGALENDGVEISDSKKTDWYQPDSTVTACSGKDEAETTATVKVSTILNSFTSDSDWLDTYTLSKIQFQGWNATLVSVVGTPKSADAPVLTPVNATIDEGEVTLEDNAPWNYQGSFAFDIDGYTDISTFADIDISTLTLKFKVASATSDATNFDPSKISYQINVNGKDPDADSWNWNPNGSSNYNATTKEVTVNADIEAIIDGKSNYEFIEFQLIAMVDYNDAPNTVTLKIGGEVAVESVALSKTELALTKGETATLTATVEPEEADQGITWTTSNSKVATVAADGKVTAVASGTATITATSTADETKKAECEVTVTNPATAIAVDETASVLVGATKTLAVTTTPADADELTYTWTSSDTSVATVANGVVTGVATGEADITVKAGTLTATCTVTVTDEAIPATDVTLNKTTLTLEVEGSETLTATITPEDSTDSVTWTTSNADVATVVNGKVTAVAEGTATITATAGNQTATCAVTVTKPEEPEEPEGIVIWSGSTALGNWANTVEINKTKFADVKAGDILRVEVADLESNAQICIKTTADGWPAIPSFLDVNEWGCIDVTKAGTYDYELTAADAAALKANNTILSGQFLTYKSLTLIVSEDTAEPSKYETGEVEAVTEYAAPTGTELYVMSITPDEAKTYNAYNVTVKVGNKSKTFEVTKCYGGFAFKDSQGNTQKIEAADGYFIVVKVTGLTGDQTAVVTMAPVKE